MHINPDKVSTSSKRKADEAIESTEPKFSRLAVEDDMLEDSADDLPINIVPNHSIDPNKIELVQDFYPSETYASTALKRERYAKTIDGDEMPIANNYATYTLVVDGKEHVIQYIPKMKNGDLNFIRDDDMNIIYPLDLTSQQPIFILDEDDNETYFSENLKEICPIIQGKPIYAKLNDQHEYVPRDNNIPYYVADEEGNQVYPKTVEGHEYYFWLNDTQVVALKSDGTPYYAKSNDNNEYYPKRLV